MSNKFNLSSSMADRANFDEVQRVYAIAMLQALSEKEALEQDPDAYAEIEWEAFEINLEVGSVEVDDLDEAKARFFSVFTETVRDWQRERRQGIKDQAEYVAATNAAIGYEDED